MCQDKYIYFSKMPKTTAVKRDVRNILRQEKQGEMDAYNETFEDFVERDMAEYATVLNEIESDLQAREETLIRDLLGFHGETELPEPGKWLKKSLH